ncbi:hypothetical protein [Microbacterium phyllosphaerae]|uniref:hypothetical protein n=1 Tax=Microbacterium phyllosphaerae TaxID=124798 RepID=UPI000EA14978|nr:hypothetical protein [Microbacterium phyllosphaerae]
MPHRRLFPVALATAVVFLVACTPEASPGSSTPTPSATASPSPTASPAAPGRLVILLDGIEFVHGDDTESAAFDDAAAVLALLEEATGDLPEPRELEDLPGYEMNLVSYDWEGLTLVTDAGGTGHANVAVSAAELDGTPVSTGEGLSVGASRSDVVNAGGWDIWDENGDGIADYLGVGDQEVPGTTSLSRPGEVGIQYVMFSLTDDLVTRITAPANDYSDL